MPLIKATGQRRKKVAYMKARKHDRGKIKMLTAAVRVKKSVAAVLSPAFAEA
jgi:hypothetical protein